MKKTLCCLVVLIFLIVGNAFGADTDRLVLKGGVRNIYITLTAGAAGAFTAFTTTEDVDGIICSVETNPGATAPTDNYDIVITNESGRNICGDTGSGAVPGQDGVLSNRDTAVTEYTQLPVNGGYGCITNHGALVVALTGNSVVGAIVVVKISYFGTY